MQLLHFTNTTIDSPQYYSKTGMTAETLHEEGIPITSDNIPETKLEDVKLPVKKLVRAGGKHQMAACTNCKKKRKKCDGKYPRCRGCINAGVDCTVFDHTIGRIIPRNYIQSLEERINELQTLLNSLTSKASVNDLANTQEYSQTQIKTSLKDNTVEADIDNRKEGEDDQNLEMEIGYITLGTAAESRYIGNSSAFSIAKAIAQSISYFKHKNGPSSMPSPTSSIGSMVLDFPVFYPPFAKPSMNVACYFWKTYKDVVQCQYPFLDIEWTEIAFNNVMVNDSQKPDELFFIYMIFAIGSQLSAATNSPGIPYTKVYYDKAMENISPLVECTTLQTVQVYLLLAMFSQKMPEASSIWQLSGLAIRSIGILGLHRDPFKRIKENPNPEVQKTLDLRARVFWSAYGIERINGIILGRPFGIADIDIDVPLPKETPETRVAIHVIKMRRIQLNICAFVYKPKRLIESPEEIDSMRVEILLELNEWVESFPLKEKPVSTFETNNWCEISYHNSVLLLLRPVVLEVSKLQKRSSPRLLKWFKVFAQSTSAVCMNYKDLLLKNQLSYSWMTIHCSFVTGLSFLYCLWIDSYVGALEWKRKSLIYDTISACSQVLFVFAEKFSTARMFRDTFERLSNIMLAKFEEDAMVQSNLQHKPLATTNENNPTKQEFQNCVQEVGFFNGVLNEQSIGIEEYQKFESTRKPGNEVPQQPYNNTVNSNNEFSFNFNGSNPTNDSNDKVWQFLDGTGDKFLRDIFCDIEDQFGL